MFSRKSCVLGLLGLIVGSLSASAGVRLTVSPWLGWYDGYGWEPGFRASGYWGPNWHHRNHHWDDWGWGLAFSLPLVWESDRWDEAARPAPAMNEALHASDVAESANPTPPPPSEVRRLVLGGLASLAEDNPVDAVIDLREAFKLDPWEAAALADSYSIREEAEFLKERILTRYPYQLSAGDAQFLKAVLFLYTGDLTAARGAVESIWDKMESTVALRRALGR